MIKDAEHQNEYKIKHVPNLQSEIIAIDTSMLSFKGPVDGYQYIPIKLKFLYSRVFTQWNNYSLSDDFSEKAW